MVLVEIQRQNMRGKSLEDVGAVLQSVGRPVRFAFVELPESELQREEAEPFLELQSEPASDVGQAQTEAPAGGGEPASDGAGQGPTAVSASPRPDAAQGTVARDSEAPDGSDSGSVREQGDDSVVGRSLVTESAEELRQQRQAAEAAASKRAMLAAFGQQGLQVRDSQLGSESESEASGSRR